MMRYKAVTKTLDINGKITISIDPDSQEFADRVFATLSALISNIKIC